MSARGSLSGAAASQLQPAGEQPCAHAVSAAAVRDWSRRAKPGERLIYFTGPFLPAGLAAAAAARALGDAGDVLLFTRRRDDRLFEWLMVRRKNVESLGGSSADQPPRAGGDRRSDSQRVEAELALEQLMAVLRRCASLKLPAPSNAKLAELALLKDAEAARYRLQQLVNAGRIRVEPGRDGQRVIMVVSTGRSTKAGEGK